MQPSLFSGCLLLLLSLLMVSPQIRKDPLFPEYKGLMQSVGKWGSMTENERKFRFKVFKENYQVVTEPVQPPKDRLGRPLLGLSISAAYAKRPNKFSVLTPAEFDNQFLIPENVLYRQTPAQSLLYDTEYSFDSFLREQGPSGSPFNEDLQDFRSRILQQSDPLNGIQRAKDWSHLLGPIFDQEECNSCYATAALNAVEAMSRKKHPNKPKEKLSVQEIIDCSVHDSGCVGGQPSTVMLYLQERGVAFARDYPYEAKKGGCRAQYGDNLKRSPRMLEELFGSGQRVLQSSRIRPMHRRFRGRPNRFRGRGRIRGRGVLRGNTSSGRPRRFPLQPSSITGRVRNGSSLGGSSRLKPLPSRNRGRSKSRLRPVSSIRAFGRSPTPSGDNLETFANPGGQLNTPRVPDRPRVVPPQTVRNPPSNKQQKTTSPSKSPPTSKKSTRFENLKKFYFIKQSVVDVLKALQFGPVVSAHFVSEPFKFYSSGVFDGDGCDQGSLEYVNHAAVIVGYDLDAPVPYFKFKNSWGDDWGERGFYRVRIGELSRRNPGECLLAGTPFMVFADVE